MADAEIVAEEWPDERLDVVNFTSQILLQLVELAVPGPARHLDDTELLAVDDVGERARAADLLEGGSEAISELGVNLFLRRPRDVERERPANRRQRHMGVVEHDRADLDHFLSGTAHPELAAGR